MIKKAITFSDITDLISGLYSIIKCTEFNMTTYYKSKGS